jgi:starch phosphorylase
VERSVVALVDPGQLSLDDLVVQVVHGPVTADGSFDEHSMTVIDMHPEEDGRFTASFVPEQAGRWGVSARALPTHPSLTSPFDSGLVVAD